MDIPTNTKWGSKTQGGEDEQRVGGREEERTLCTYNGKKRRKETGELKGADHGFLSLLDNQNYKKSLK